MQEGDKYYKTLKPKKCRELSYTMDLICTLALSVVEERERESSANVMPVQTGIHTHPILDSRSEGGNDDEMAGRHDGLWPLFLLEYRDHVLQKAVGLRRVAAVCLCLAVVAVLAAACDGNPATQTPVDTPAPTNAPTPTEIPTPTDTPLPAETPTPTKLPAPTDTSVPTLAPTATVEVHPTTTPTADVLAGFSPPDPVDGVGDVHEALIGGQRFRLEVARTPAERARGLMNRENLAQDSAMLFIFQEEAYRSFWMKNTLIPFGHPVPGLQRSSGRRPDHDTTG